MFRIREIRLNLEDNTESIPSKIEKILHLNPGDVTVWKIIRESVDARHKPDVKRVFTIDFEVKNPQKLMKKGQKTGVTAVENRAEDSMSHIGNPKGIELHSRPVIVGFGPCGIFAALLLARKGYRPVVLERGKALSERIKDVRKFWNDGDLNPASNVQFGEGGAGAFSDGKLNSGIRNSYRTGFVLEELRAHGAPEEILYRQNPHIGTDLLRKVVVNIRKEIEALGGEVRFESCVTGIIVNDGKIEAVQINNGAEKLKTEVLMLAPGHSARDTFYMLKEIGLEIQAKPFSIGARIEHLQSMINESQYGSETAADILGAADYKLSYKCKNGRGVYTFCMCPGGYVVASASEYGGVVTNGMSYHSRKAVNANSALLVGIEPSDFESEDPLAGIEFQRKWERAAFKAGGSNYCAPVQLVGDFLNNRPSEKGGAVIPEYRPGVKWTDISVCLPEYAAEAMREALPKLGKKLKGFDNPEAVLTAVETRSSSPVRIIRNEQLQAHISGIFPAGEGAGYAGGIMSAAADGLRVAEKICEIWKPQK